DDASEVRAGFECGLTVTYSDSKVGDIIETYELVEKPREEDAPASSVGAGSVVHGARPHGMLGPPVAAPAVAPRRARRVSTMAGNGRAERLGKRIGEIVATAIEHEIKDPRLEFVTITDSRITGDL